MKMVGLFALSLFRAATRVYHSNSYRLFSIASSSSTSSHGKFDPNHHKCLLEAYNATMDWWKHATQKGEHVRCKTCWNLQYNCFCDHLRQSRTSLASIHESKTAPVYPDISIYLYYHLNEVGRSCNTGHLLEALCPEMTKSCVFGNVEEENKLIEAINREDLAKRPSTCILFPSKDAMSLSEWLANRANNYDKVNLIALDGTYNTAPTLLKHLQNRCALLGIRAPVVKLDFEGGQHVSSIAQIKPQPRGDKICTYEAVVVAMKQVGVSTEYCDHLLQDLNHWKQHIIDRKIRRT